MERPVDETLIIEAWQKAGAPIALQKETLEAIKHYTGYTNLAEIKRIIINYCFEPIHKKIKKPNDSIDITYRCPYCNEIIVTGDCSIIDE